MTSPVSSPPDGAPLLAAGGAALDAGVVPLVPALWDGIGAVGTEDDGAGADGTGADGTGADGAGADGYGAPVPVGIGAPDGTPVDIGGMIPDEAGP